MSMRVHLLGVEGIDTGISAASKTDSLPKNTELVWVLLTDRLSFVDLLVCFLFKWVYAG
jgi:hypothetical protein